MIRHTTCRPVNHWQVKTALLLNFLVLALLLNSVGAIALQLQRAEGITASAAGMLAVYKGGGIAFASALTMIFLARIGYRRAMLVSLAGLGIICGLVPFLPAFATLKLLFFAAGLGFATIKVSAYATVGLITDGPKAHAAFMSFLESFFTFGVVAGYFLFSAFLEDTSPQTHDWLRVFYVLSGLSLCAWLFLLGTPLDETRVHATRAWRTDVRVAARLAFTDLILCFGACVFLYVMIEQSAVNWMPTFNHAVLHLSPRLSVQMAGLLTIALALGRLVGGVVLQRIRWFPVLLGCLLSASVLVCIALASATRPQSAAIVRWADAPAAAYLLPLIGFFLAPIYPAINSVALSATPTERHGPMASIGVIFSAFGSSLGTLSLGYLFDAYGGHRAFYFALAPIAGLFGALFLLHRQAPLACRDPMLAASERV